MQIIQKSDIPKFIEPESRMVVAGVEGSYYLMGTKFQFEMIEKFGDG